jgi:hypothetical protein
MEPAFGRDGHALFSQTGIPRWTPLVDSFFAENGLNLRDAPLPTPSPPALQAPTQLGKSGYEAFERYLIAPPHKAFAMSPDGRFAWRTGRRSINEAKEQALEVCGRNGRDCRVIAVDDALSQ